MASLVDYEAVLTRARAAGFRCGYPNGAAFVLAGGMSVENVACWSASDDGTIREAFRPAVVTVSESALPGLAVRAWREFGGGGDAWLAPVHHWSASLLHGDGAWLGPMLEGLGFDPGPLEMRARADALAFDASEEDSFASTTATLLANLAGSDFALLLPGAARGVFCTVHHHGQLWWQCAEARDADRLRAMAESGV